MPDEMDEAEWFSALVDGEVRPAPEDAELLRLSEEIHAGLAVPTLDAATRNRILVAATRLADASAPSRNPVLAMAGRVRVNRKTGIAIGGAALVGVGAAVGIALIHGRQGRRGLALAGARA